MIFLRIGPKTQNFVLAIISTTECRPFTISAYKSQISMRKVCFKPNSQKNVPANNYHLKVLWLGVRIIYIGLAHCLIVTRLVKYCKFTLVDMGIPYSRKIWRGIKFGGLAVCLRTAKFFPRACMYGDTVPYRQI